MKQWLQYLKKSKTLQFNLLVGIFGVLELNLNVLEPMLGEHYGIVFMIIAMINVVLRVVTTMPLKEKE